jgi:hypothetical protein
MGSCGEGSVTCWIGDLKSGGDSAALHLWDRYFERLVCLARKRLRKKGRARTVDDEEDAAFEKLGCAVSSVKRKLDVIRQTWLEHET